MASGDMNHAEKKFRSVGTTQDSIQSVSLWVIHHKAQHEKIVEVWFRVLKKSKTEHRLTLFYICNDIVQTCKKKHAIVYKDAFKEVLKDASMLVRDHQIRNNVKRIYMIWRQREIYDKEFVDELIDIVDNTKVQPVMSSKLVADFQPLTLMEKVITLNRYENELEHKRRQLVNLRMDASSLEAVRQLKDRKHGKEFCQEFEGACTKMEEYVKCVEKEIADRNELIELLELSELYYDAQYGEAKIVANAYKNFGGRVNTLSKKLSEKLRVLPDTISPMYSPPGNASSSPDVTPPRVEEITSPKPEQQGKVRGLIMKKGVDNNEAVDMDLSDGEDGTANTVPMFNNEADESSYSPKSDAEPAPQASPIVDTHQSDANPTVPSMVQGASKSFFGEAAVLTALREDEPVRDEGGSTPVMDEEDDPKRSDSEEEPPKKRSNTDTPVTKTNPIDFLTSLINQTPSSTGSSSTSFFQNLGVLVNSAKTEYKRDDVIPVTSQSDSSDGSWASWKAQQYPQPPQPTYAPPQPPVPPGPYQPNQPSYVQQPGYNPTPYAPPMPSGPAPPGGPSVPMPYGPQTASHNGGPPQPGYPPPRIPGAPPNPAIYGLPPGTSGGATTIRPLYPMPPTPPGAIPYRPTLSIPNSVTFEPRGQNTSPQNAPYPPGGPVGDFRPRGPYPHAGTPPTPPGYQGPGRYPPPRFPGPRPDSQNYTPNNFPGTSTINQRPHNMGPTTPTHPRPPSGPPTPNQQGPRTPGPIMPNHQGPPTPGGYRPPLPPMHQGFVNMNLASGPPPASQAPGWPHSQGPPRHNFANKTNLTTIKTVEYSGNSDPSGAEVPTASPGVPPRYPPTHQQGPRPMVAHTPPSPRDRPRKPEMSRPEDAITADSANSAAMDSHAGGGEGQQEFIDKLRRKSNMVGDTAPDTHFDRQNSSNLRTLTEVSMDSSDGDTQVKQSQPESEDSQFSIGSFVSNMRKESDENSPPDAMVKPPINSMNSSWSPLDGNSQVPRMQMRPHRASDDFAVRPFRLGGNPRFPRFGAPPAGRPPWQPRHAFPAKYGQSPSFPNKYRQGTEAKYGQTGGESW